VCVCLRVEEGKWSCQDWVSQRSRRGRKLVNESSPPGTPEQKLLADCLQASLGCVCKAHRSDLCPRCIHCTVVMPPILHQQKAALPQMWMWSKTSSKASHVQLQARRRLCRRGSVTRFGSADLIAKSERYSIVVYCLIARPSPHCSSADCPRAHTSSSHFSARSVGLVFFRCWSHHVESAPKAALLRDSLRPVTLLPAQRAKVRRGLWRTVQRHCFERDANIIHCTIDLAWFPRTRISRKKPQQSPQSTSEFAITGSRHAFI